MSTDLDEATQKELFRQLIELEDAGTGHRSAVTQVAEKFGVTERQVNKIVDLGSDECWPPLEPCDDEE